MASHIRRPYTVPENPWGQNRAARLELAAVYRILDSLGLNEGVVNHISVLAPNSKGEEIMLILPNDTHWSEARANSLVEVSKEGKQKVGSEGREAHAAALSFHQGLRKAKPEAKVIIHCHPTYSTTLASLKDPRLMMVHQCSCRFYQRVAYDDGYTGHADNMEGAFKMGQLMGDKDVLMLANHGIIVVANSIPVAFEQLYYLERSAMFQVLAMSTGQDVREIPDDVCVKTSRQSWSMLEVISKQHFYHLYRKMQQTNPEFEH